MALCLTHFDSEDDYCTGCRNRVSHCQQQQSYSGLRTFTPTIKLNLLLKWLLGSNLHSVSYHLSLGMIADYRRRMRRVGKIKTLPLLPESIFGFFFSQRVSSSTDTVLAFNPVAGSFRELISCVFLFLFLWFCLFLVPYPLRKVIFFFAYQEYYLLMCGK